MISSIINSIAEFYQTGQNINKFIGSMFGFLLTYKTAYLIIGVFFTRKFKKAKRNHKYGICIAARNEKYVIGNLLDSINKQDYPKDLYQVFVVADNCTDNTAEIVRSKGAICYERFDDKNKTKGFALQFLFKQIEKDYKIKNFEGFFIFDADNLLKQNYISKMNDAFDEGCKIITSYRNTKNFDENWISSTYALHWLRSIRSNHRARSVLRLATNIQGTGFLFSNEIVKDGWKYTSLTEDRALTADAVAQGYEITYQDEAEFFDEQPTNLKVALRQRLRWSKGHLQAFVESGPYLFINIFLGKKYLKTKWKNSNNEEIRKKSFLKSFIESIRHRIASFDTLMQLTPISFINLCRWLLFSMIIYGFYSYVNGIYIASLFNKQTSALGLNAIEVAFDPGLKAAILSIIIVFSNRLLFRISQYFSNTLMAIYLLFIEHKRIKRIKFFKKCLFVLTWPIFDIIGRYTTYIAIFKDVTWKPIPHESKITIEDLKQN